MDTTLVAAILCKVYVVGRSECIRLLKAKQKLN